jgi:hypothetical protein
MSCVMHSFGPRQKHVVAHLSFFSPKYSKNTFTDIDGHGKYKGIRSLILIFAFASQKEGSSRFWVMLSVSVASTKIGGPTKVTETAGSDLML